MAIITQNIGYASFVDDPRSHLAEKQKDDISLLIHISFLFCHINFALKNLLHRSVLKTVVSLFVLTGSMYFGLDGCSSDMDIECVCYSCRIVLFWMFNYTLL